MFSKCPHSSRSNFEQITYLVNTLRAPKWEVDLSVKDINPCVYSIKLMPSNYLATKNSLNISNIYSIPSLASWKFVACFQIAFNRVRATELLYMPTHNWIETWFWLALPLHTLLTNILIQNSVSSNLTFYFILNSSLLSIFVFSIKTQVFILGHCLGSKDLETFLPCSYSFSMWMIICPVARLQLVAICFVNISLNILKLWFPW